MKKQGTYSLLLISPRHAYRNMWTLKEVGHFVDKKVTAYPLALPTIAAMTPDHYDIKLVDEEMEPVPFHEKPDIVGISSMVTNTTRAYEIADRFRGRGVPVVMGGPHTTLRYRESLDHADSVVVGEAEGLWDALLEDFEKGSLRKIYKTKKHARLDRIPIPRWDLVDTRHVLCLNVQISRGCPNACEFCCVTRMFGSRQRYRGIDNVIEELESLPLKQVAFVDDNFTADKDYVRDLMRRMKPMAISWTCLAGVDVSNDEELLRAMADAGCNSILLGFESLNPQSLAEAGKSQNRIEDYELTIKRIHRSGIHVIGAFVVGFDADTLEAFDQIFTFADKNDISYVMLNMLTAFPGTGLYRRMKKQGRLLDVSPELLNGMFPSMRYKNMSEVDIFTKYFETLERLYAFRDLRRKALNVLGTGCFNKRKAGVGFAEKLVGVRSVLRELFFTMDGDRRRLLIDLFRLGMTNIVTMDVVFEYLFFITAANKYLENHRDIKNELLGKIAQIV